MENNKMEQKEFEERMARTREMVVNMTNEAAANVEQLNGLIESDHFMNMEANEVAGTAVIMEFIVRLQNKMLWNIENMDLTSKLILKEAMEEIAIEGVIGGEMRDTISRLNNLQLLIKATLDDGEGYRKKINVAIGALEEAFDELKEEIIEKGEQDPGSQEINSLIRMMTHSNW